VKQLIKEAVMRTFNLRHQAIPLGLARSDWLILSIIVAAGRSLVRLQAVFVCCRTRVLVVLARVLVVLAIASSGTSLIELAESELS
jgi:hypothetical protein